MSVSESPDTDFLAQLLSGLPEARLLSGQKGRSNWVLSEDRVRARSPGSLTWEGSVGPQGVSK